MRINKVNQETENRVVYNANKYGEGVNVFVSVNRSYNQKGEFQGRSLKSCIAQCWYFHKAEEQAIQGAFDKGLPVTVSGILHGEKVATFLATSWKLVHGRPDRGHEWGWAFELTNRIYEGAPIWKGSLGAHAVAVK